MEHLDDAFFPIKKKKKVNILLNIYWISPSRE